MKDTNLFFKYLKRAYSGLPYVNQVRIASTVLDTETITIGTSVFEFDTNSSITAGNIKIDVSGGATASAAITAAVTAINGAAIGVTATAVTGGIVLSANSALALSTTMAGTNNVVGAAAFYGGKASASAVPRQAKIARVPTATEVALGLIQVPVGFTPNFVDIAVRTTSTGAKCAWDGAYAFASGILTIDNTGATDWATTHTLNIELSE